MNHTSYMSIYLLLGEENLCNSAHEIISSAILLPSADSITVVSYKQKCVHEVLVNGLVKLAQEKVLLGALTILTLP